MADFLLCLEYMSFFVCLGMKFQSTLFDTFFTICPKINSIYYLSPSQSDAIVLQEDDLEAISHHWVIVDNVSN